MGALRNGAVVLFAYVNYSLVCLLPKQNSAQMKCKSTTVEWSSSAVVVAVQSQCHSSAVLADVSGYKTTQTVADDFRFAGRGRPGSRSAASMMLDIPRTTTSLGDRAFVVAGPRVWNSLPPANRDPSLSLSVYGKLLKTPKLIELGG